MRALKTLVIVLGIAVLVGFGALVAGLVYKANRLADETGTPRVRAESVPPVVAAARAPWGRVALEQPAGTRIQSVTSNGEYIVLHLYTGAPGEDERVVVVDAATGLVMGTIAPGAK